MKIGRPTREQVGRLATILDLPSSGAAGAPAKLPSATPCASCGVCCRTYVVPVCGHDVWRISRSLQLDPSSFLVAWQEEEPGTDGFRLEPGGPLFTLVLDKRSWATQRSACRFLLRFPGGQDRCGIYDHRPVACRSYPMLLLHGDVVMRDDPLCPPGAWSTADVRDRSWRQALQQAHMQYDIYKLVAAHWNARLEEGRTRDLADYYAYVLRAYDALEPLGPGPWERWRLPGDPMPWQSHLDRVRAALAGVPTGPDYSDGHHRRL